MNLTFKIIAPTNLSSGQVAQYTFDELGGTIGRKPGNDFVLTDPERYISSKHAVIEFRNGHFYLTDTSTNGVLLNNSKQAIGAGKSAEIMNGDKVTIGTYQLLAHISDARPVVAKVASADRAPLPPPRPATFADPLQSLAKQAADIHDNQFSVGNIVDPLELLGGNQLSSPPPGAKSDSPISSFGTPSLDDLFGETEPYVEDKPIGKIPDDIFADLDKSPSFNSLSNKPHPVTIDEQFTPPSNFIPEDWDFPGSSKAPDSAVKKSSPPSRHSDEDIFAVIADSSVAPMPVHSAKAAAPRTPINDDSQALLQAFMQGCQVDLRHIDYQDQIALMVKLGELTRIATEGLMQALRARAAIKSNFRVSRTTIAPTENNPLKFSVTTNDALTIILSDDRKGYMPGTAAFKQGFDDLQSHQLALMAGMQATISAVVTQFNPTNLEKSFEAQSGASFIPGQKKAKNWDLYIDFYNRIREHLQDDFQNIYGEEFAKAYEEQIMKLSR